MEFKKYQHLERFGSTEVNGIEEGICYVFPKIDGTNASLWVDDCKLKAGSRNRELTLDNDNAGFYNEIIKKENILNFFDKHPNLRLYGEWLVPHSLKTYQETAWKKFYVFDVMDGEKYIPYEQYKNILDEFSIEYIPPLFKVKNPTDDSLYESLNKNTYLIEDGKGTGEGVVVKNYEFVNRYKRTVWAKIVTNDFKVKHQKEMGVSEIKSKKTVEESISEKYVTKALVDKEFSKIENECGWSSKMIPRLLNVIFYCIVKEESWNFVKEFKNPTVNFGRLQRFVFAKAKTLKPEIF